MSDTLPLITQLTTKKVAQSLNITSENLSKVLQQLEQGLKESLQRDKTSYPGANIVYLLSVEVTPLLLQVEGVPGNVSTAAKPL